MYTSLQFPLKDPLTNVSTLEKSGTSKSVFSLEYPLSSLNLEVKCKLSLQPRQTYCRVNVWLSDIKVIHYTANSSFSLATPVISVRTKSKSFLYGLHFVHRGKCQARTKRALPKLLPQSWQPIILQNVTAWCSIKIFKHCMASKTIKGGVHLLLAICFSYKGIYMLTSFWWNKYQKAP